MQMQQNVDVVVVYKYTKFWSFATYADACLFESVLFVQIYTKYDLCNIMQMSVLIF